MADKTKALLDYIGDLESKGNYNAYYGNAYSEAPLDGMTVGEILAYQKQLGDVSGSSAIGKYQIKESTLRQLIKTGKISKNAKFTPALQDKLAKQLLEQRGYSKYASGKMTAQSFGNSLAKEWAALPLLSGDNAGKSYYAGDGLNKALDTAENFLLALSDSSTSPRPPANIASVASQLSTSASDEDPAAPIPMPRPGATTRVASLAPDGNYLAKLNASGSYGTGTGASAMASFFKLPPPSQVSARPITSSPSSRMDAIGAGAGSFGNLQGLVGDPSWNGEPDRAPLTRENMWLTSKSPAGAPTIQTVGRTSVGGNNLQLNNIASELAGATSGRFTSPVASTMRGPDTASNTLNGFRAVQGMAGSVGSPPQNTSGGLVSRPITTIRMDPITNQPIIERSLGASGSVNTGSNGVSGSGILSGAAGNIGGGVGGNGSATLRPNNNSASTTSYTPPSGLSVAQLGQQIQNNTLNGYRAIQQMGPSTGAPVSKPEYGYNALTGNYEIKRPGQSYVAPAAPARTGLKTYTERQVQVLNPAYVEYQRKLAAAGQATAGTNISGSASLSPRPNLMGAAGAIGAAGSAGVAPPKYITTTQRVPVNGGGSLTSSSSAAYVPPVTFKGTSTGNTYAAGQSYTNSRGQSLVAQADGSFVNPLTGKVSAGSSQGKPSGSTSSGTPLTSIAADQRWAAGFM